MLADRCACSQMQDEWKPPSVVDDKQFVRAVCGGRSVLDDALSCERDKLMAVAEIMESWGGDGATSVAIPESNLAKYVWKLNNGKLTGLRTDKKSRAQKRQVWAAVPAARLLKNKLSEIRGLYAAAYVIDRPPPLSKLQLKEQAEEAQEKLEDEIATMNAKLNRMQDAKRQAAGRGASARHDWQQRFRERASSVRTQANERAGAAAEAASKEKLAAAEAASKEKLDDMNDKLQHSNELRLKAHARARHAEGNLETADDLAAKRLKTAQTARAELENAVAENEELREQVTGCSDEQKRGADAIAKLAQIPQLRTVAVRRADGGGTHAWENGMRQVIMEQRLNGTPANAIPANIVSLAKFLVPFVEDVKVPTKRFCRNILGELRVVTETMAALLIARADNWRQLFTDGTSRRQTHLLNVIIGIDGIDGNIVPMILRAAMIGTGETAEQQVGDILEMAIKRGGKKLARLREIFEELFPGETHNIPDVSEMNIAKLANGMITSDNCNAAMKVKRLFVAAVQEAIKYEYTTEEWDAFSEQEQTDKLRVLEGDCYNHLRNVWFGRVTNGITNRLNVKLKEELEAIDFHLRVGTDMAGVLRACDKEFSLCCNYPKGHGDQFREWVFRKHPRALLYHVVSTDGGRMDMACEGAGPFYMNRCIWIEFLDERLRQPNANNILQESLFIQMSSIEIIASARIHAIIFLSIVVPHRWLAGNSHLMAEHGWSERSMSRTADLLERTMVKVLEGDEIEGKGPGELMLDLSFMFSIWNEIALELEPFRAYLTYMYETKKMALTGSSITEHQYAKLRDELFNPAREDNIAATETAIELAVGAAEDLLEELRDPKKATSRHLSSTDGQLSWGKTTAEEHAAAKGKLAVDDPAESCHGATTREIHCAGRISLGNAGALGMSRRNGDFARASSSETRKSSKPASSKEQRTGAFYSLTPHMREALLTMGARDAPAEMAMERTDLSGQREARRRKEELAAEVGRHNATEQYIDRLYYYEMWGAPACWKTASKADTELTKLESRSAKLAALKEQIRIRVLGLGWSDLSTAWSKDGAPYTPAELMMHLKKVISEQARRTIPNKPPVPGLQRKELSTLGTSTSDAGRLDAQEAAGGAAVEAAARAAKAAREAKGIGDSYQARQGSRPDINEALISTRIEVICHYDLPEGVFGDALMWCSGEVVGVEPRLYKDFPKGKSALVRWDANDRVTPPEPVSTSGTKLMPSLWNKDSLGAWRFDLDPPPVSDAVPVDVPMADA